MAVYTTIDNPGAHYSTALYTGTGSSLAVTGVGFSPDFTWIKNRDAADFHVLTDTVRGATKYLKSDTSGLEVTDTESLKSFDSDGFTVGTTAEVNTNTEDFVSWNWKMGTTTGIAGSPTITPNSYSFNQTAGQSIIQYTGNGSAGATVSHGLGAVPMVVIVKKMSSGVAQEWCSYHQSIANTKFLQLDSTLAASTGSTRWNDTTPTSTVFSIGTDGQVNVVSKEYIAYCFTPIQGYSSFGLYTGDGNSEFGAFIYTGFRPAFVLSKSFSTDSWCLFDNKRVGYNSGAETAGKGNARVFPDTTAAASTDNRVNFFSLGFNVKTTDSEQNTDGTSYIYMAFAESPIVNSSGVPTNAR